MLDDNSQVCYTVFTELDKGFNMTNMTLGEQIQKETAKSRQMRNPSRFFYYSKMAEDVVAMVSWEQFRGSWAHANWTRKHQQEIQSMIDSDNHRFPWNPWKSI